MNNGFSVKCFECIENRYKNPLLEICVSWNPTIFILGEKFSIGNLFVNYNFSFFIIFSYSLLPVVDSLLACVFKCTAWVATRMTRGFFPQEEDDVESRINTSLCSEDVHGLIPTLATLRLMPRINSLSASSCREKIGSKQVCAVKADKMKY